MLTDSFYLLLASLVKRSSEGTSLYLAVGEGLAAWDKFPPTPARDARRLAKESFRKRIDPADVVFLDAANRKSEAPSPRLLFSVTLAPSEASGTLRECGLFAGAAGPAPNSGTLFSYVIHTRITKTPDMELERSLHMDLTPHAPSSGMLPGQMRYLANSHSKEFHDLNNLKPRCRIQSIRVDHRQYLASAELALALGYDYCSFCFPPGSSKR